MSLSLGPALTCLLAAGWRGPLLTADSLRPSLILRDVAVIDGTGAATRPHMVVLIEGGRIRALAPLRGFHAPPGVRVVEGGGRIMVPGLWDMHVHTSSTPASPLARGEDAFRSNSRYFLPLFVAWGVTGIRDMSGSLDLLTAWRDSVKAGTLLGPRMVVTGFKLGSPRPTVPGAPFPLRADADVGESVRLLRERGADFVKVAELPAKLVPALAAASRREGLPFVGHLPADLTLVEASLAGQKSVEHLDGVLYSLSARETQLRKDERRLDGWWTRWLARFHLADPNRDRLALRREVLATTSPERARALYALLARQGTWQVPTLSQLRDVYRLHEVEPFSEEGALYLPPPRLAPDRLLWERDPALARQTFAKQLSVVGEMFHAGVPLMAGTDTPGLDRVPGFSLVEELDLLVRAGLSPMAALQAATREPARFLGAADTLGTIEPGKVADLVLLDADPLIDIRNLHRVHSVVLRGRYLSPREVDSLRTSVRNLVTAWRDSVAGAPVAKRR